MFSRKWGCQRVRKNNLKNNIMIIFMHVWCGEFTCCVHWRLMFINKSNWVHYMKQMRQPSKRFSLISKGLTLNSFKICFQNKISLISLNLIFVLKMFILFPSIYAFNSLVRCWIRSDGDSIFTENIFVLNKFLCCQAWVHIKITNIHMEQIERRGKKG
jgi:hypothetical protein